MLCGLEILWLEIIQQHICMKMDFVSSTIVGFRKQMNHMFSLTNMGRYFYDAILQNAQSFVIEYNPR